MRGFFSSGGCLQVLQVGQESPDLFAQRTFLFLPAFEGGLNAGIGNEFRILRRGVCALPAQMRRDRVGENIGQCELNGFISSALQRQYSDLGFGILCGIESV